MGTKPLYHCKLNRQRNWQRKQRTSIKTLCQQSWDSCCFSISPATVSHHWDVRVAWHLTLQYFPSWTIRPVSKTRKKAMLSKDTLSTALHVKTTLLITGLATLPLNFLRMTQNFPLTKMANRIRFHGKRLLKCVTKERDKFICSHYIVYSGSFLRTSIFSLTHFLFILPAWYDFVSSFLLCHIIKLQALQNITICLVY